MHERDLDYLAQRYGTYVDWIASGNSELEDELRSDLESVFDYLCDADRTVITLYDRGLSQDRIGEVLGVAQTCVSSRLKHIKKRVAYFIELRDSLDAIMRVFRRLNLTAEEQSMVLRWLHGARQTGLVPGWRQGRVSWRLVGIREEAEGVYEGEVLVRMMLTRSARHFRS